MVYKHLLLVEGVDDQFVLQNLLKHYHLPVAIAGRDNSIEENTIVIAKKDGFPNLRKETPGELRRSDLERLGIIVDADTDIDARWRALQDILRQSGNVNLPSTPDPDGTIVAVEQAERTLTVGIWIMPDNKLPGMLEDFVSFLVPKDDTLWNRAADCLQQIPEQERPFSTDHQMKAHLHTWLAWRKKPGKPLGLAITSHYLDADAPHAQKLMAWLRRLFDI